MKYRKAENCLGLTGNTIMIFQFFFSFYKSSGVVDYNAFAYTVLYLIF